MLTQIQHWNNKDIVIILGDGGLAAAQMMLYKEEQNFGGTAWIWDLWVSPFDREKGLARQMLTNLEYLAKREGHKSVHLEWEAKNTERWVLDWYLRQGYEIREQNFDKTYALLEKKLIATEETNKKD
jgi:ribosomal protein S18 acetylase RimI-like enzyme